MPYRSRRSHQLVGQIFKIICFHVIFVYIILLLISSITITSKKCLFFFRLPRKTPNFLSFIMCHYQLASFLSYEGKPLVDPCGRAIPQTMSIAGTLVQQDALLSFLAYPQIEYKSSYEMTRIKKKPHF